MNSSRHPVWTTALLSLGIILIALACGCSDSTEPDSGGGDPPPADVPGIPEPGSPGAETGALSDTVTVIFPLKTHYRPMVKRAMAGWSIQTRCCDNLRFSWECDNWAVLVGMPPTWSDQLPELTIDPCGEEVGQTGTAPIARPDPWRRILLVEDGAILQPEAGESGVQTFWELDLGIVTFAGQYQLGWQTREIAEVPHIRRDRFWVRQPIHNYGNFLLLIGDVDGEVSTTNTWGSSVTETEEFGRSVTTSAGLNWGALSLGVEVTLSQTFSTSVTVSEESTETFTQGVNGKEGQTIHYQVWQLWEVYTITDADGNPFTDPNYDFELSTFTIRNGALALVSTPFDS